MIDFKMPTLGADMESGTLVDWKIKVGDQVHRGDIVAEVETQKGTIEIEAWESGRVRELVVEPGTEVKVGGVLAQFDEGTKPTEQRLRVSPLARKIAASKGLDLRDIPTHGERKLIKRKDVESYLQSHEKPSPQVPRTEPEPTALRQAIAKAMSRSKKEIPHYYLETTVNMESSLNSIELANRQKTAVERILPQALYLKAVSIAVGKYPEMNGFFTDGKFHQATAVHVGVAISLKQGGVIAPAIHDVDKKSITDLMRELVDLVARARAGRLRSSEISDATITVTSLGDQGVDTVIGVIYPPQVALLGFGAIREMPWAENGWIAAKLAVKVSLAADHRVSDGHRGALFLRYIRELLSQPESWMNRS